MAILYSLKEMPQKRHSYNGIYREHLSTLQSHFLGTEITKKQNLLHYNLQVILLLILNAG